MPLLLFFCILELGQPGLRGVRLRPNIIFSSFEVGRLNLGEFGSSPNFYYVDIYNTILRPPLPFSDFGSPSVSICSCIMQLFRIPLNTLLGRPLHGLHQDEGAQERPSPSRLLPVLLLTRVQKRGDAPTARRDREEVPRIEGGGKFH